MLGAALQLYGDDLTSGPAAEISGPDEMYVPTTQIRTRPGGPWHRRSAIATETACGEEYAACVPREYELEGELCPHCFTIRERWLAKHPSDLPRKHRMSPLRFAVLVAVSVCSLIFVGRVGLEVGMMLIDGTKHAFGGFDLGWVAIGMCALAFLLLATAASMLFAEPRWRHRDQGFAALAMMIGLSITLLVCLGAGCSSTQRGEARAVIGQVVDCTKGKAKDISEQLGPVLEHELVNAIDGSGKVDWSPIEDLSKKFTSDVGGCALATAVAHLVHPPPPSPDAPQSAPLDVDTSALLQAWTAQRAASYGGQSFHTPAGDI
jgi:hypothetical protein